MDREEKRHPLSMRTTKGIRDRLEIAASKSGRSLSGEVEFRLEVSFRDEDIDALRAEIANLSERLNLHQKNHQPIHKVDVPWWY